MFIFACVLLVFGAGLTGVKGNPVSAAGNLIEVANQIGYDTFIELLTAANLRHTLEGEDKYIVFAPTNHAFEEIGQTELSRLKSDPVSLKRILQSHISQQKLQPDGISDGITLKTLTPGHELKISFTGNGAFVNGKEFNEHGIEAINGILYPTNKVLYSSVNGESSSSENLIEVLNNNGCKTLALLITEANLPDLQPSGTYTIFAPKDEAFASLSSDELRVMKSNHILLKNLIKSHIIEGEILSYNLEDGLIIESLSSGYSLKFLVKDNGSITVNNVPIVRKDLKTSNSVVNVISNILISSSKGLRSENLPAVLKITEDSITNVEHEVGSFLEVTGLMVEESSKDNTSFYIAVNENTDVLPPIVDETSERNVGVNSSAQKISQNGEHHNSTANENDAETTVNTLEVNKSESEQTNETKKECDSSLHLDPIEPPKVKEETNNTLEARAKISEENTFDENLNNGNESSTNEGSNSSTESSTSKLHEDSGLNEEATTENKGEDSTTVAGEAESSPQSESSTEEAVITNSTIATSEQ